MSAFEVFDKLDSMNTLGFLMQGGLISIGGKDFSYRLIYGDISKGGASPSGSRHSVSEGKQYDNQVVNTFHMKINIKC